MSVAAIEGVPANAPPEMVLERELPGVIHSQPLGLPHKAGLTGFRNAAGLEGAIYGPVATATQSRTAVQSHLVMVFSDSGKRYWLLHMHERTSPEQFYLTIAENMQTLNVVKQSAQADNP